VRNPYQKLFERRPDEVIADGVAVYNGDFILPEAAALQFIQKSRSELKKNPAAALDAANAAVSLVPRGFNENIVLGDALVANGMKTVALSAYAVAQSRIPEMEPTAQEHWEPILRARNEAAK